MCQDQLLIICYLDQNSQAVYSRGSMACSREASNCYKQNAGFFSSCSLATLQYLNSCNQQQAEFKRQPPSESVPDVITNTNHIQSCGQKYCMKLQCPYLKKQRFYKLDLFFSVCLFHKLFHPSAICSYKQLTLEKQFLIKTCFSPFLFQLMIARRCC